MLLGHERVSYEMNINSKQPLIDSICIGSDHTIIKDEHNNLYGYGNNQYGQLGRDINDDQNSDGIESSHYK